MEDRLPRRLVAILYADVAGYSRLTGVDEDKTHRALNSSLDAISAGVKAHRGVIIHYAGDAVLARFDAVMDALSSAVSIQNELSTRDINLPPDQKVQFRMGINLGDVIEDRGEIYGDGVNVAARLESLADPGGICISDAVRLAIGGKLPLSFEFMGEREVKNIAEPIRAYQVRLQTVESTNENAEEYFEPPVFGLPRKPSIAVLSFSNMSGDPEQEYFSDGIAEDIITALSKISGIMVVARNSTFCYKGKPVDIRQVGREQGVHYVLEGSVRKAGSKVRVTAQLIDAGTNQHLWAERYDRSLDDIFAVQDEIVHEIVVALDVQLAEGEQARIWSSGTRNLEAWECLRLAAPDVLGGIPENKLRAHKLIDKAIKLDPDYAMAWVMLGYIHQYYSDIAGGVGNARSRETALDAMLDSARTAIDLDPTCADAYTVMAYYHRERKEFEQAVECSEKSIAFAPNNAENLASAAGTMTKAGRPERGLELAKRAIRVCPLYRPGFLRALATAYRFAGEPEKAVDTYRESLKREASYLAPHVNLASTLGELGRIKEAEEAARNVKKLAPDFSIKVYMAGLSYRNPEDALRVEEGLRRSGLPT